MNDIVEVRETGIERTTWCKVGRKADLVCDTIEAGKASQSISPAEMRLSKSSTSASAERWKILSLTTTSADYFGPHSVIGLPEPLSSLHKVM